MDRTEFQIVSPTAPQDSLVPRRRQPENLSPHLPFWPPAPRDLYNRVYTEIGNDELYLMIPGARLADIVRGLGVLAKANDTLREYHKQRKEALTT